MAAECWSRGRVSIIKVFFLLVFFFLVTTLYYRAPTVAGRVAIFSRPAEHFISFTISSTRPMSQVKAASNYAGLANWNFECRCARRAVTGILLLTSLTLLSIDDVCGVDQNTSKS